jgi:hypothetical protein
MNRFPRFQPLPFLHPNKLLVTQFSSFDLNKQKSFERMRGMPSIRSPIFKSNGDKKKLLQSKSNVCITSEKKRLTSRNSWIPTGILQDKKMTKTIKLLCVILTCSYATGLELDASKSTHSINILNISSFILKFGQNESKEVRSGNTLQSAITILSLLSMT